MLYVTNAEIDTKGMIYPRALQQTTVGCYLLNVCLIGLFAIGAAADPSSTGPLILMIISLVFSIIYHLSLNQAMAPLLNYLPRNLEPEEEELLAHQAPATSTRDRIDSLALDSSGPSSGKPTNTHEDAEKTMYNGNGSSAPTPQPGKASNLFLKFLQPNKYADYYSLRELVPHDFADISYSPEVERNAYYHPAIGSVPPLLWIPRDKAGVSRQEVAHTSKVIPITDDDASIDDKGKITWNEEKGMPPIYKEKIYY